jgi:hypothetical protein
MHPTASELQAYNDVLSDTPEENLSNVASHLRSCELCQARQQNLREFRGRVELDSRPGPNTAKPAWEAIEDVLDAKSDSRLLPDLTEKTLESAAQGSSKIVALERKVNKLSAALIALAACLALVIAYPLINPSSWFDDHSTSMETELASTIAENNELQQRFSALTPDHVFQQVGYFRSKRNLQMLDKQIQLAYLEDQSIEHKIVLWEQRKQIILNMLEQHNKPAVIFI